MSNHSQIKKSTPKLSKHWIRAAYAGGLWASLEIIIGSFLHNIRMPFSGSILAAVSTILLIAFFITWKDKNLIWRAGIICALMKSLSPSAVILGPLTGILMEAFLLYFIIYLFKGNIFSFILGSILSVCSALIHKIISLLIVYGNDIIQLYINFFNFSTKQLGFGTSNPIVLILILLIGYIFIGILSALIGIRLGYKVKSYKKDISDKKLVVSKEDMNFLPKAEKTKLFLLIFHVIMFIFLLWFISTIYYVHALIIMFLYVLLILFMYKRILRRFKKPVFWIQLVILLIISVLFYENPLERDTLLSFNGLLIGLKLVLRALFVVSSFSGISVELANPIIVKRMEKGIAKNLFNAIKISFQALPVFIDLLPSPKKILFYPLKSLSIMIVHTSNFIDEAFKPENLQKNVI